MPATLGKSRTLYRFIFGVYVVYTKILSGYQLDLEFETKFLYVDLEFQTKFLYASFV